MSEQATTPPPAQDGTMTVPPDRDLGAMVEAIIDLTTVQEIGNPALGELFEDGEVKELWRCAMIRAVADRLAVALKEREGVMEEMAKALEPRQDEDSSLVFQVRVRGLPAMPCSPKEAAYRVAEECSRTLRMKYGDPLPTVRVEEAAALAKYEACHG